MFVFEHQPPRMRVEIEARGIADVMSLYGESPQTGYAAWPHCTVELEPGGPDKLILRVTCDLTRCPKPEDRG